MAAISSTPVAIAAGQVITNTGSKTIVFHNDSNLSKNRFTGWIFAGNTFTTAEPMWIAAFDGDSTYTTAAAPSSAAAGGGGKVLYYYRNAAAGDYASGSGSWAEVDSVNLSKSVAVPDNTLVIATLNGHRYSTDGTGWWNFILDDIGAGGAANFNNWPNSVTQPGAKFTEQHFAPVVSARNVSVSIQWAGTGMRLKRSSQYPVELLVTSLPLS